MTNYDLLIDTLTQELYEAYNRGASNLPWDASQAKSKSHKILMHVEEFQSKRTPRWRATD